MGTAKNYQIRQKGLVPQKQIKNHQIAVVGVGAVGRPIALQLACMGVGGLILIDPDTVEDVNVGTQMYAPQDIGRYKSVVTGRECMKWLPPEKGRGSETRIQYTVVGMVNEPCGAKFEEVEWPVGTRMDVIFCCVDTMAARQVIWDMVRDGRFNTQLWLDTRVQGEVMRIFAVPLDKREAVEHYIAAWYPDEEAFQGRCTDRMTLYSAYVAAGMAVGKYVTWMRRKKLPLQVEIGLNIQTGDAKAYGEDIWWD